MNPEDLVVSTVFDGPSDRVLLSPLRWLLNQHVRRSFRFELVDLARMLNPPRTLAERISVTIEYTGCDVLFVHRDAEGQSREARIREIHQAATDPAVAHIPVVPIRMSEAWLLFDAEAIRTAAGNPRDTSQLELPRLNQTERTLDPKEVLQNALKSASGLHGRRLRELDVVRRRSRVAELIEDFSPLRALSAFAALERDLSELVKVNGW